MSESRLVWSSAFGSLKINPEPQGVSMYLNVNTTGYTFKPTKQKDG